MSHAVNLSPPKQPAAWLNYERVPDVVIDGVRQLIWRRGRIVV